MFDLLSLMNHDVVVENRKMTRANGRGLFSHTQRKVFRNTKLGILRVQNSSLAVFLYFFEVLDLVPSESCFTCHGCLARRVGMEPLQQ